MVLFLHSFLVCLSCSGQLSELLLTLNIDIFLYVRYLPGGKFTCIADCSPDYFWPLLSGELPNSNCLYIVTFIWTSSSWVQRNSSLRIFLGEVCSVYDPVSFVLQKLGSYTWLFPLETWGHITSCLRRSPRVPHKGVPLLNNVIILLPFN